ncbi:MAG: BatD family protein [Oligoflexales bacterium]
MIGKLAPWVALIIWVDIASAGTLTGSLDKSRGSMDDQFVYTLAVSGDLDDDVEFPKIDGLEIEQAGTSHSTTIINGKVDSNVQYRFLITPTRTGKFTIPEFTYKVDGQKLSTLPIDLTVGEAAQQSNTSDFFIEEELSNEAPYEGEAIIRTVRLFHKVQIAQANRISKDAPFVRRYPSDDEKSYSKVINGETYSVVEIKEVLVPEKAGDVPLERFELLLEIPMRSERRSRDPMGMFDDFFSRTRTTKKKVAGKAHVLKVKPLPLENRPNNFSGLIGKFRLEADVSIRQLGVGDTSTLTLRVNGEGSAKGMAEPVWTAPQGVKIYKDKPIQAEKVDPSLGLLNEREFKYAIVPEGGGQIVLGEAALWIFNPETGSYEKLSAELGALDVTGAPKQEATTPPTATVESKQQDKPEPTKPKEVLQPFPLNDLAASDGLSGQEARVAVFMPLLALFSVVGFWLRKKVKEYRTRNHSSIMMRRAYKDYLGRARSVKVDAGAPEPILEAVKDSYFEYLKQKYGISQKLLKDKELVEQLSFKGMRSETATKAANLWREIDRAMFSGGRIARDEVEALLNKTNQVVEEIENADA